MQFDRLYCQEDNKQKSRCCKRIREKTSGKDYDLADVYHCDNIDRVSDDFIAESGIIKGSFDNVGDCQYTIPTYWEIGKVYERLIKKVAENEKISVIDALMQVYNSFISLKIDDYNSSVYYENPSYIFESYREKKIL